MNITLSSRAEYSFSLRFYACLFFIFSLLPLFAQNWSWVTVISGNGEMDLSSLAADSKSNTYLTGTFTNSFSIQNEDYHSFGLADNYMMKLDDRGEIVWILTGGSEGNDLDAGICVDTNDALYWVGGFWGSGTYGNLSFNSTKSSKSLFFIKYNRNGAVLWSKLLEGSNTKNSSPPATDLQNNVYLTGSFSDTLFIDNQIIIAQSREDVFVGKWNANGELIWVKNFGINGLNRAKELVINQANEVIIGGEFKGKMAINKDTIATNTPDFDIFLASLASNGDPLWLRKAGGVLEDSFNSLAVDKEDNNYLVGQFTGRLTLSEAIEVTTQGFNENGYLLTYDHKGMPLSATSFGGINFETTTDILVEKEVIISGNFENELSIGGQTINGNGILNGYVLKSNFEEELKDAYAISSDNILLINRLELVSENLIIGGTFKGTANFNNRTYSSLDHFSIFIGTTTKSSTPTIKLQPLLIKLYPNPATRFIKVETPFSNYFVQLWNTNGQKIYQAISPPSIPVTQFPPGAYLLEISAPPNYRYREKVLIY